MWNQQGSRIISIIIPVYNERDTIIKLLDRVLQFEMKKEVIIIDDGSTDGTAEILRDLGKFSNTFSSSGLECRLKNSCLPEYVKMFFQPENRGKGSALRKGFHEAKGDIILVQDADLEYHPRDYHSLISPILTGTADVVYGSRFLGQNTQSWSTFGYFGNKLITTLSNWFTGYSLTDVWTGYKVFNREILEGMTLNESGFEMEIEFTSKLAQRKWRILEVPISYYPRSQAEGKKISWQDGIKAIRCMIQYRTE